MPSETVLAALRALLDAIGPLKLPSAIVGGLALAFWRHARFTKDVDVLVSVADTSHAMLAETLQAAGFQPKRGDGLVRIGNLNILQLLYHPPDALIDVQVDLLLAVDAYQQEALARRVSATIEGFDLPVDIISCEDLILHKLLAGRMIDMADAAALLKANRESVDLVYLLHWTGKHALGGELRRVWDEAFPGEPVPDVGC